MAAHSVSIDDSKAIAPGTLYLVGTPIGNLEDITLRSLRVLQQVDWIAAEDTRRTGQLLKHFEISTRTLSYHAHNRQQRIPELIAKLERQAAIALVTDAGMPAISDPGVDLVRACIAAQIPIVPIPGPTACVTALVASGLPTDRFTFEGFLPAQAKARRTRIAEIAASTITSVLYEAPHRLVKTLQELSKEMSGDRQIVFARELTKTYEEFWRGSLQEAIAHVQSHPPRGEFAIVLAGAEPVAIALSESEILAWLQQLLQAGVSRSQASRQVAQQAGRSRRDIYKLALTLPPTGVLNEVAKSSVTLTLTAGWGLNDIAFGFSESQVVEALGAPDKALIDGDGDRRILYYALRCAFWFRGGQDRLHYIRCSHPSVELFGRKLIGQPTHTVMTFLEGTFPDAPKFDDYKSSENYLFPKTWLEAQFEYGTLKELCIGHWFDENDNPVWPQV